MFKILYILSTLEARAPVKQLFYIIKYLDRKKFYPIVLTLSPEKENSYRNLFLQEGIEIITLNNSRLSGLFLNKFALQNFLKEFKPHLLHSQGYRANMLLKHFNNYKRVVTLRANPFKDYVFSYGEFLGNMIAAREIRTILLFDRVICVSKSLADIVYKESGRMVEYIYNGLEYSCDSFLKDRDELKRELNLPLDKKIFIVVGNLIEGKDPKTVIKAFKLLNRSDFYLLFLGEGRLLNECREMIGDLGEVKGFVKNVKDYLYVSDYFISASLSEGMPNAVLEALSCGLGVILSDINAHKEILGDGYFGELFNVENPFDLKEKILKMIDKDKEKVYLEAKKRVKKDFNAKKNSLKYQKVYKEILEVLE